MKVLKVRKRNGQTGIYRKSNGKAFKVFLDDGTEEWWSLDDVHNVFEVNISLLSYLARFRWEFIGFFAGVSMAVLLVILGLVAGHF